jgi:hypothetical protein
MLVEPLSPASFAEESTGRLLIRQSETVTESDECFVHDFEQLEFGFVITYIIDTKN